MVTSVLHVYMTVVMWSHRIYKLLYITELATVTVKATVIVYVAFIKLVNTRNFHPKSDSMSYRNILLHDFSVTHVLYTYTYF